MKKKFKDVTIGELVNTCSKNCTLACDDTDKCPFKKLNFCFLFWKNFKDLLNQEVEL